MREQRARVGRRGFGEIEPQSRQQRLDQRGLTPNTLIVFSSDNGGPLNLGANNGDLRAGKATLYEGGIRVDAWATWPGKLKPGVVNEPLHMVDWYPTLLRLAGASPKQPLPLDGRDAWPTIAEGTEVRFDLLPKLGRWEATGITPR